LGATDNTIHRISLISSVLNLPEPAEPHLYVAPKNEEAATRLIPQNGPILAIAPMAADAGKTWPAEHFAEIGRKLLDAGGSCEGWRVAIFGGMADAEASAPIVESLAEHRPITLFGQTDLLTVYAALSRCQAFIGNDSGLSHLAAAAGLPTLAVFGPTDPVCYRPWGKHCKVVRADTIDPQVGDLAPENVEAAFCQLLATRPTEGDVIENSK
jgi:ADP-heptose:LPS heptosyltransferase